MARQGGDEGAEAARAPSRLREPELVTRPQVAELADRLAAVDGEREHAGGVLVEQQLARLRVRERAQVARRAPVADVDRAPEPAAEVARRRVELDVAVPVD